MDAQGIKGTLEKQLQLLSERSKEKGISVQELVVLTRAMNEIASYLLLRFSNVT